jgi:Tol biopolymer transport system component
MPADVTRDPTDQPLETWKAIAAYLNRDARTVMRWEKQEDLPVHRLRHASRSSIYAYPSELDAWRANRRVAVETKPTFRLALRVPIVTAIVAIAALSLGDVQIAHMAPRQSGDRDRQLPWPTDASLASTAMMSPDGRYVSYIDMGDRELHVRDLREGRAWQVARIQQDGGFADDSLISHDGTRLVFDATNKDHSRPGLWILPVDATPSVEPRLVAGGQWITPRAWSADDREVVVTTDRRDKGTDIGVVTLEDGVLRARASVAFPGPGPHVSISPDGRFLAYDAQAVPDAPQRDVYVVPVPDGQVRAVLTGSSSDSVVGWAPDGRLIIMSDRAGSRGVGLWALPMTDGRPAGEPILLTADFHGDPLTLTATNQLFYEQGIHFDELLVTRVDLETGARLGPPESVARDGAALSLRPRWSPAGSMLYVTYRPTGPVLSIRHLTEATRREIPLNLSYLWTYDWSPDERWLVCRAIDLRGHNGIFLIDLTSAEVRLLAEWTETTDRIQRYLVPQFSTDGRSITYTKALGAGRAQYIERNLATGVERVLDDTTPSSSAQATQRRSPDGRTLLVVRGDAQSSTLVTYDLATKAAHDVFSVPRSSAFNFEDGVQWTPDSRALVANVRAAARNTRELWWIPVDGRAPHRIDLGVSTLIDSPVAIHPDGQHIAFVAGDPIPSKTGGPATEFRVLDLDGR